ncbi:MAG: hypothetical protein IJ631_04535 [Schwartzia sp.]|nr:hypothetical protein [Schwartzia sp. (in: firmicutes)]
MQKRTLTKRIVAGLAAGMLSASLLVGCGGGSGGGSGAPKNDPPKAAAPAKPARAAVATAPTMTFKFGNEEAKVYELTGVDLKKKIRTGKIVKMGDDIFFHTDTVGEEKETHINKVTVKGETISGLADLGMSGDIDELATNGKTVLWQTSRKEVPKDSLAIYDGKERNIGGKWPGSIMGDPETGEFVVVRGKKIKIAKLENGEMKDVKTLIEDYSKASPDYERVIFKPVCVDKGEIYLRCYIKKEGEKNNTPYLIAFDKDGKELRRYEGVKDLPRGWAVTENYVVHTGSKGDIRVFDKKSGNVIGDAKIEMRPFELWTATGNDVIVYDDRADKFYRIDF